MTRAVDQPTGRGETSPPRIITRLGSRSPSSVGSDKVARNVTIRLKLSPRLCPVGSEFMAPRAYWKGHLKLSLVSCPIALFPATSEREKISFHQLNKTTGHRIKYQKVDADTGDVVASDDIIKGSRLARDSTSSCSRRASPGLFLWICRQESRREADFGPMQHRLADPGTGVCV